MRRIAIAILLVVAGLVLPLLISSRQHTPSAAPAVVEARPLEPPAPSVVPPPPTTFEDRGSRAPTTVEEMKVVPRDHRLNVTHEQYRAQLDRRFEMEHADPSWSAPASSRLAQQLVERLPVGSELVDVDCRESMCRVRANHQDQSSFVLFSHKMAEITADDWTGGMLATRAIEDGEASHDTIAYLGRSGTPLPDPVEP